MAQDDLRVHYNGDVLIVGGDILEDIERFMEDITPPPPAVPQPAEEEGEAEERGLVEITMGLLQGTVEPEHAPELDNLDENGMEYFRRKPKVPLGPDFKPFRLADLPVVVREKAMRYLDPIDLFDLSLCSRRMSLYVKNLRIEAQLHTIALSRNQNLVSVHFPGRTSVIWWDFQPFGLSELNETRKVGNVLFKKCERSVEGTLGSNEFYCLHPNIEEGVAAVSEHFQYLFKGPLNIGISPNQFDVDALFSHKHLQTLNALDIGGAEQPWVEKMNQIFKKVKVQKRLHIRPMTNPDYIIPQALQVEEDLKLKTAAWMSGEHLLQMNCRIVQIFRNNFVSGDIEALAEKWMEDKSRRWERISIQWDSGREFRFFNLNAEPWDESKRESHYAYEDSRNEVQKINCTDGFDMERDDGELATFVLEQIDQTQFLHFLVWKERFPEKRRLEELPAKLAPIYEKLEMFNKMYPDTVSLERTLSNPTLTPAEFLETFRILRNLYSDGLNSIGSEYRRACFMEIKKIIEA